VSDRILIAVPGIGTLALDYATYREALSEGAKLGGSSTPLQMPSDEPLLDAEQLSAALGIAVTWIEQKAREGVIPSLEFGRWRRFRRTEVEAAVRAGAT
jgi:excisionase family DNA binding protein